MPISLSDLISSPALGLRTVGRAVGQRDHPIGWVAVTELEDPLPFLTGGEVLLTTGLRQKTAAAQRNFVRRAHEASVLAIGFGVGLSHRTVPPALIAEADRLDLPVLAVPYETPFIAIGKCVADAISADRYAELEQLLQSHQVLASVLLSDGGLPGLLQALGRMLSTDVVLTQYSSEVAASGGGLSVDTGDWDSVAISSGLMDRAALWLRRPFSAHPIVNYAQSLIGVELSNQAKQRAAERTATGQVLQDIIRGSLSGADAAVRLGAAGVSAGKHAILLIDERQRRRSLTALPLPAGLTGFASALVGEHLAIIVSGAAEEHARRLTEYLQRAGLNASVGQGGSYPQAGGLRWSYFEAKEALSRGQRLNRPERLSLTSLLLASGDVPLADLAAEVLDPLLDFDAKNNAELLPTLQCYLESNGSVAAVAAELQLHRNSVRYRLAQISELTGCDPAVTADRVHLWLALSVRKLGQSAVE